MKGSHDDDDDMPPPLEDMSEKLESLKKMKEKNPIYQN